MMEYPNGSRQTSQYQHYIRAAHRARSAEVYRLLGMVGRGTVAAGSMIVSPLVRAARNLSRENRIRAAKRQLHAMDDRMLADMGITRENIDEIVRNGRSMPDMRPEQKHPHEAKQAARVVELRGDSDVMGAIIVHGPWARYIDRRHDDAA